MLIRAQCSDREGVGGGGKKGNSSAQSPCEAHCRENIVFKLITCFMYLDGRTSHGYKSSFWVPGGQSEDMNDDTENKSNIDCTIIGVLIEYQSKNIHFQLTDVIST